MIASHTPTSLRDVAIPSGGLQLQGELGIPLDAQGLVLFAHGSGSSRLSPRNQFVARTLRSSGLATLLFDLLSAQEESIDERTRHLRFDIPLLAGRLLDATHWVMTQPDASRLPLGYFGASTGAAAALIAASRVPRLACAVVSRGGRPDLAGPALPSVRAATLLIVGGDDGPVITLNQQALAQLRCAKSLRIVPGATHLFEEPGALEMVSRLAAEWFLHHLHSSEVAA